MFNQIIKEERKLKGLSQAQLAEILETTQSTIGKYERKLLEPNLNMLIKIADYFQVTTDYLIGRSTDYDVIETKKELLPSEEKLLKLFHQLSLLDQGKVLGYMDRLLQQ